MKHGVKVNLAYEPAFYPIAETLYEKYEKAVPKSVVEEVRSVR